MTDEKLGTTTLSTGAILEGLGISGEVERRMRKRLAAMSAHGPYHDFGIWRLRVTWCWKKP